MTASRKFSGKVRNGRFLLPKTFKSEFLDPKFKIFAYLRFDSFDGFKVVEKKDGFYFIDLYRTYENKNIDLFVYNTLTLSEDMVGSRSLENILDYVYINVRTNRSY